MSSVFEELGHERTPLGDLSLRRRRIASLDRDVYEIKLGDEFLMSSLFTESETVLGTAGVAAVADGGRAPEDGREAPGERSDRFEQGDRIDVVVGGLGLGYTAAAVLDSPRVRSLLVVELFAAVIEWHQRGLVPMGRRVSGDPRCRIVEGDFFPLGMSKAGFDPDTPGRRFDAILVDIDHTPNRLLDSANARFYEHAGLAAVRAHLAERGVLGVWSDHPPDPAFTERLDSALADAEALPVVVDNPLRDETYTQSVYLARRAR